MRRLLVLAVSMAFLAGCASARLTSNFAEVQPSDHKSIVYLYRPKTSYHSLNPEIPVFYFNGSKVGPLNIGGYYAVEVEPGPLEISFSDPIVGMPLWKSGRKVKLNIAEGQTYFVKYELEWGSMYFDLVPPSYGLKEIQTVKLLKP